MSEENIASECGYLGAWAAIVFTAKVYFKGRQADTDLFHSLGTHSREMIKNQLVKVCEADHL
jgi:hypothetical protein